MSVDSIIKNFQNDLKAHDKTPPVVTESDETIDIDLHTGYTYKFNKFFYKKYIASIIKETESGKGKTNNA